MDYNDLTPPTGKRDFGQVILATDGVAFSLSTIIVALRLVTRVWIIRNFGWDDVTIALAQMITAVGKAFVIVEVSYALGRHKNLLPLAQYTGFLKYDYLDWAQCFLVLAVTKISICLFLLRLSVFNNLRKILWGLISFLVISHLTLFFLIVFQCEPIHKVWDTEVQGTCFRKYTVEKIVIVQGVFSVVTDLICAAFPAVLLWRAKIGLRTKIALCLLMGLGVITAALSIARTCFAWQVRSDDLSWVGVPNAMCRIMEVNVGIIAACTPIMKPFVRYIHARMTGRDPQEVLPRVAKRSYHFNWILRPWGPHLGSDSNMKGKRNPVEETGELGQAEDMAVVTEWELGLPIQGQNQAADGPEGEHELRWYGSKKSLETEMGEPRPVYDAL